MEKILARDLLKFSTEELWKNLRGKMILVFDDGVEVQTNWKKVAYSSYCWEIIRRYPKTPLLSKHLVDSVIGSGSPTTSTHLKLLEIVWDVYDAYPDINRDILALFCSETSNKMYNDFTTMFSEYVGRVDVLDLIEILDHPVIKKANDEVQPTEESIEKTYKTISEVLKTDPELRKNPLARSVRSKTIKEKQLLQSVGPRGFLTDIDSRIFVHPILSGYGHGITMFHDQLIESRSASKSLMFSKKPLQEAEYFSRKLQLLDQSVQRIHHCDCGSTDYMLWHVRGAKYDDRGKKIFNGDLERLAGKWRMCEDGNLRVVKISDKHLIGETIKLRHVFGCQHSDPYGICSKCFGELSLAVFDETIIGHMTCTSMTQKSSQSVLSVKHLDGSSAVDRIIIDPAYRDIFGTDKEGISYLLQPGIKGKVTLILTPESIPNINDVVEVSDIGALNINRISSMNTIGIRVQTAAFEETSEVPVGFDHRPASLTYNALAYIRKNGWEIDELGNYVIDLTNWDRNKPLLTLPLRHYNMSDHSKEIADMIQATVRDLKARDNIESIPAAFIAFFDLVNWKLDVNVATLEIVFYGAAIRSAEQFDYRLPKPGTSRGMGVMKYLMSYRSLSAAMAYQGHRDFLTDPVSYLLENRPDHPMDHLLMPLEVNPDYR